ncbi:MAG: GNAT family N-acetyltransferase [Chloroflexota bacterium]
MTVRPARHDEAGDIAELWLELVAYHQSLDPALPLPAPDGDVSYGHFIMNRIERPDSLVLVAVNDRGVVVGYALTMMIDLVPETFEQQKAAFIADIYVQESARRHGHGRALYKAIVDWCALNDLQTLELEVAAHNPAGRAFWQAMGGRELMVRMRAKVNTDDGNDETLSDG